MNIDLPELSPVVLIGPSGSGKSSFARKHFKPTEILSSDYCRGLVSDDDNEQAATKDAFEVRHFIAREPLAAGGPGTRMTLPAGPSQVGRHSRFRKPAASLENGFNLTLGGSGLL